MTEERRAPSDSLHAPPVPLKDCPRKGVEGNRSSGAEGHESQRREEGGCHRQRLLAARLPLFHAEPSLRGFQGGALTFRVPRQLRRLNASPPAG